MIQNFVPEEVHILIVLCGLLGFNDAVLARTQEAIIDFVVFLGFNLETAY